MWLLARAMSYRPYFADKKMLLRVKSRGFFGYYACYYDELSWSDPTSTAVMRQNAWILKGKRWAGDVEDRVEAKPVFVVGKDVLPIVAPQDHVINGSGYVDASLSCHEIIVSGDVNLSMGGPMDSPLLSQDEQLSPKFPMNQSKARQYYYFLICNPLEQLKYKWYWRAYEI